MCQIYAKFQFRRRLILWVYKFITDLGVNSIEPGVENQNDGYATKILQLY